MKIALLVSTYNWPEALNLVLQSILIQTVLPDEVLIADDGSTKETSKLIEDFKLKFPKKVIHVWQEDKGFRKAKILNKALAACTCDYIIQVDGDCILHKCFIEDHKRNVKENMYLFGSRVKITSKSVDKVLKEELISFSIFSLDIKNRMRNLYFPFLSRGNKIYYELSRKFRGCNVSFWKKDFMEVNGYNEDFEGWGREDSELIIRFHNKGLRGKRLKFCAIVFHIFHKTKPRDRLEINDKIQAEVLKNKKWFIKNGVDKYINT